VRCASPRSTSQKNLERAVKVTDLLLQSGGFGIVAMDLGNIAEEWLRRIPLASWFRFQRAVENTPTVLLALEEQAHAKSCAALIIHLTREKPCLRLTASGAAIAPTHAAILPGVETRVEISGQQMRRKFAAPLSTRFRLAAAWEKNKPTKRQEMPAEYCLLSA